MSILNKIFSFFSKGLEKQYDTDFTYKIILFFIYSILGSTLTIFYSIYNLIEKNYFYFGIYVAITITIYINYLFFRTKKNYYTARNIIIILFSLSIVLLIFSGDFNHIGLFWSLLFPPFIFNFLEHKKGFILSILFMFFIAVVFYFHLKINPKHIDNQTYKEFWFLIAYAILVLFVFLYQFISTQKESRFESEVLENQKNNFEKDEIITKLSFQLRTPINNIIGLKNILENTALTEQQKDILNSIEASVGNLIHVIEKVDSASGFKIDGSISSNIAFDLNSTISRTLEFYLLANKNIKIDFKYSEKIPEKIIGNPIAIKQIFINLIEMAIKNKINGALQIYISVNAEDINNEKVKCNFIFHIFENIQLKSSIDEDKILELSIIKHLIEKLNGKLKITFQKNSSIFEFSTEFENNSEYVLKPENIKTKNLTTENEDINSLKDAKILVVEDNDINQKVIELSLRKLVKIIDFANNGKEALELFGKNKYDLIIMDIQMPIMDGFKTTQKIREAEVATKTHIPIIAITANALIHDKKACIEAGMDDYIAKPYKIQEVIKKIENLIFKITK